MSTAPPSQTIRPLSPGWPPAVARDGLLQPDPDWAGLARDFPAINALSAYDESGRLRVASRPLPADFTTTDRDYFRDALAQTSGELRFTGSLPSRVSGAPTLFAYAPVLGRAGAVGLAKPRQAS